jgi:hypothetical protein
VVGDRPVVQDLHRSHARLGWVVQNSRTIHPSSGWCGITQRDRRAGEDHMPAGHAPHFTRGHHMTCPVSGHQCPCTEGSIKQMSCRGLAVEVVENILTSGSLSLTSNQEGQVRQFTRRLEAVT